MTDNSKKLDELESKMHLLESALDEIKAALKEKHEAEPAPKTSEDNLTEDEKQKIESIMNHFDFEKVHNIMKFLDWKWAFSKNGTPSVEELKKEAHRLLVDACEEKTTISTGGFKAIYEADGSWDVDDDFYLGLEFIVEDCEGFTKDEDNEWVE